MASSQAVYLKSGDQPRAFTWGPPTAPVYTTNVVGFSNPLYKESVNTVFQASITGTLTNAQSATVNVQVSMDDNTGRGFILGGEQAPGFIGITTAASATVTAAAGGIFTQALVGGLYVSSTVPAGTTVASVAANGLTLTLSSGAGVTAGSVQSNIFAQNWCQTAAGIITLSGTVTNTAPTVTDGFTTASPWRYVRLSVSAIAGTLPLLNAWMGC